LGGSDHDLGKGGTISVILMWFNT